MIPFRHYTLNKTRNQQQKCQRHHRNCSYPSPRQDNNASQGKLECSEPANHETLRKLQSCVVCRISQCRQASSLLLSAYVPTCPDMSRHVPTALLGRSWQAFCAKPMLELLGAVSLKLIFFRARLTPKATAAKSVHNLTYTAKQVVPLHCEPCV